MYYDARVTWIKAVNSYWQYFPSFTCVHTHINSKICNTNYLICFIRYVSFLLRDKYNYFNDIAKLWRCKLCYILIIAADCLGVAAEVVLNNDRKAKLSFWNTYMMNNVQIFWEHFTNIWNGALYFTAICIVNRTILKSYKTYKVQKPLAMPNYKGYCDPKAMCCNLLYANQSKGAKERKEHKHFSSLATSFVRWIFPSSSWPKKFIRLLHLPYSFCAAYIQQPICHLKENIIFIV